MGFAVIGYPTKRQSSRSIHDQLPYRLRSENDDKLDISRQKSLKERRKKNARRLKKQRLVSGKLKESNTLNRNNNNNNNNNLLTDDDELDRELIESTWLRRNINTQYDMVQTRPNWLSQINTVMRSRGSNVSLSSQKETRSYYTGRDIRFKTWQPSEPRVQNDLISGTIHSKSNRLLKVGKGTNHSNGKLSNSMESKVCNVLERDTTGGRESKEAAYQKLSSGYKNSNESDLNSQVDLKKSLDLESPIVETVVQQSNTAKQTQINTGTSEITNKLSLDKLPPEVIQKIFIFSFANYNMLLTNKYLNYCLKLSDHLLEYNFIENYIHIIDNNKTQENNDNMLPRVKYLNTKIFDDPIMTRFFLRRLKHLKKKFNKFITDDMLVKGLAIYKNPSLPRRLYVNTINDYFKNVHILKYFFKHFEVVVISLIDNIIDWFFQFQTTYKIQHFLHIMKIIKKYCKKYDYLKDKTNFTAHHLVSILEHLFLNDSNKQLVTIDFFQGLSSFIEEEEEIEKNIHNTSLEKLKIKLVGVYLSMFYKLLSVDSDNDGFDINTVLNDPSLWNCLRKISNIELIDVFVSHGVRPSYGHII